MTTRIKHIVLGTAVTLALLASSSPTWAQSYYGVYRGYRGYHASTGTEGYLRGRAALIQAQAQARFLYSQALRQREAARQQYLANRLAILRYYAQKQQFRAQRIARQRAELARRREVRERLAAKQRLASKRRAKSPTD